MVIANKVNAHDLMAGKQRSGTSDRSSDLLRRGGPNSLQLLVNGVRHASRGAMFVAGVSMVIAMVSVLARV